MRKPKGPYREGFRAREGEQERRSQLEVVPSSSSPGGRSRCGGWRRLRLLLPQEEDVCVAALELSAKDMTPD